MATHIERVVEKIHVKEPVPVIDFTQHTLEDGNVISTQERVVKDVRIAPSCRTCRSRLIQHLCVGTSTSDVQAYPRAIL